eukprot:TRINITY_DN32421_c0_g1_i1.p1 TRINITY_DN32421_c0_g1~~TRINITY_DN32421_c0_g1_i1.p1  ORF type:complete len:421 (-),score=40.22 TRINITY_DN32421_c0_g1_i1:564-1826(-)
MASCVPATAQVFVHSALNFKTGFVSSTNLPVKSPLARSSQSLTNFPKLRGRCIGGTLRFKTARIGYVKNRVRFPSPAHSNDRIHGSSIARARAVGPQGASITANTKENISRHSARISGSFSLIPLAPSAILCAGDNLLLCRASTSADSIQAPVMEGKEELVPGVIIGAGRVGSALAKLGGGKDIVVRRGESVPADSTGPIFVCTRNDALDGIVESTPEHRREDLVFLQNGMIEPWLEGKGLATTATQLLVYFAVAKVGEDPIDGKTDVNPEGLTAVTGKWAKEVAARLHHAGLSCKVLDPTEFRKSMLEKLIWISAFMLVGARHPSATCGDVEKVHSKEVVELIEELAAAASKEKGVDLAPGFVERLCAYARSVANYPTAVKEFEWRNGWFYGISQQALAEGKSDPCPLHTTWLKEVGAV